MDMSPLARVKRTLDARAAAAKRLAVEAPSAATAAVDDDADALDNLRFDEEEQAQADSVNEQPWCSVIPEGTRVEVTHHALTASAGMTVRVTLRLMHSTIGEVEWPADRQVLRIKPIYYWDPAAAKVDSHELGSYVADKNPLRAVSINFEPKARRCCFVDFQLPFYEYETDDHVHRFALVSAKYGTFRDQAKVRITQVPVAATVDMTSAQLDFQSTEDSVAIRVRLFNELGTPVPSAAHMLSVTLANDADEKVVGKFHEHSPGGVYGQMMPAGVPFHVFLGQLLLMPRVPEATPAERASPVTTTP